MTTLTVFLQISELIAPLAMVGTVVIATLKAVAKPMGLPARRDKSEQKPILKEGLRVRAQKSVDLGACVGSSREMRYRIEERS